MNLIRTLLALLMLLPIPAMAAPSFPPLTGRVVDAAKLLTPEQKAELEALSASVEQASTRQLVVATIPDLQGYDIADYGFQLGRAWQIGQKDANNGIILIVAPNERKVRIEVGYGLEPIMTDALSNRIIQEQILPRFRDKDIPGGIVAGANAIAEQMKLPLEAAEQRAKAAAPPVRSARHRGFPIEVLFVLGVVGFVIVSSIGGAIAGGARGRRYGANVGGGGGSGILPVVLWGIANEIGREAGRGSWGGGGSSWGGGGGGSDWGGGGGGGFSGGGGSFGGGGASGSW